MNVIVILCDTLRRDHCGPYHRGRPLNACWSDEQPGWVVPTPNLDRLAARGTVFENCWCGSTPCMPARRDIYTGRYEFLERGWGPLEDDDLDLPRQVSGPPNRSLQHAREQGYGVSYLVTDHFHLWEQGSGNYHMGYSGFEFLRGHESDAWYTHPLGKDFFCTGRERGAKTERQWRNVHHLRRGDPLGRKEGHEEDWFCARVFETASRWLEHNHGLHENYYLHLDCFDPHEPWDPPEYLLKKYDPRGYNLNEEWVGSSGGYAPWRETMNESQLLHTRARYAAMVELTDRWLGRLLDTLDRLDAWKDTLVVFTTDHGTFNGDHGRMGKLQTHEHDAKAHIPFVACHPQFGHGERREQLVQLVDLYPTVLAAAGRPIPERRHGVNLLPLFQDAKAPTRDYALAGMFGKSVTLTDGRWVLHQSPVAGNQPLFWHGHHMAKFIGYDLGTFADGRREVSGFPAWKTPTWLSDRERDPNERVNLADREPETLKRMQGALARKLKELDAPAWQFQRLGL
ncbi:MAG: sulfatase [Planctomycetota bacterium]|nr:sulfatase [Planctomycetota bacterium]